MKGLSKCSCDDYSDLWDPFFQLLKKYWKDCPYKFVLNTESKTYKSDYFDVETFQFYKPNCKVPWGKRLIKHLKNIETDYVIIMLEDYFLYSYVNQKRLDECIEYMESHKNTAHIRLSDKLRVKDSDLSLDYYGRFRDQFYMMSLQPGLWRREDLIRFTLTHYTPWDFEVQGSKRCWRRFKEDFLVMVEGNDNIIPTDFRKYGVSKKKWQIDTVDFFEKNNINIDFSERGIIDLTKLKPYYPTGIERLKHKFKIHNAVILVESGIANIKDYYYYKNKFKKYI